MDYIAGPYLKFKTKQNKTIHKNQQHIRTPRKGEQIFIPKQNVHASQTNTEAKLRPTQRKYIKMGNLYARQ